MAKHKFSLKSSKKTLLLNTVMLYILTFSNQFLSLAIVPYESRILGPSAYGMLGVATTIMVYFQLVIDFGFLLSGTQDVSLHREDKPYLCRIFSAITCGKLILTAFSAVVLISLCAVIPAWQGKTAFYALFFISTASNSMLPDFLYRGLEKMSAITIRTVCIKAFFTAGILLFMKKPEDVWMVPAITAVGNLVAVGVSYLDLRRRLGVWFCPIRWKDIWLNLKRSSVFFYSRVSTTVYSALNTLILDSISATGAPTGYYTASNNLINAGKNALSPISDSMYPYMVKHRDFKLVKKVLLIFEPIIILFCVCVFIWAEPLCVLYFGKEYAPVAQVLRAMLPVGIVILPSYILGFPTLSAMGMPEQANYSVIFGSVLHVVNLMILYFSGHMNMITLGAAVSVAETLILLYRIAVIWRHRGMFRKG